MHYTLKAWSRRPDWFSFLYTNVLFARIFRLRPCAGNKSISVFLFLDGLGLPRFCSMDLERSNPCSVVDTFRCLNFYVVYMVIHNIWNIIRCVHKTRKSQNTFNHPILSHFCNLLVMIISASSRPFCPSFNNQRCIIMYV